MVFSRNKIIKLCVLWDSDAIICAIRYKILSYVSCSETVKSFRMVDGHFSSLRMRSNKQQCNTCWQVAVFFFLRNNSYWNIYQDLFICISTGRRCHCPLLLLLSFFFSIWLSDLLFCPFVLYSCIWNTFNVSQSLLQSFTTFM